MAVLPFTNCTIMLTFRSALSKETHNTFQKFDGLMTGPCLRNAREMTLGMLLGESSYLSRIGSVVAGEVTPRKNTERYSRMLGKIDTALCTKQHIACASLQFRSEPVLLLWDGGDYQKPHARAMKKICKTVDGSNGHAPGRGYPTFAAIAYGLTSKRQLPLVHHLYSTVDSDFNSAWGEQKQCLQWCAPFRAGSTQDRINVEDRGGDDEKHFLYYTQEAHMSFLTRINTGKTSRNLCPVRRGEIADEAISVQEIVSQMQGAAGASRQWKNRKIKKTLISSITFQEVRLPDHPEIPLFLVLLFTTGFKDPIVLLTDIAVQDATKAWEVFFWYKKRWEVENFFRAIKQEFSAEKFLIRSFAAIRALAFIAMLAFCLLRKIRESAAEIFGMLLLGFQEFCRQWQRGKESHMDLLQWIRVVWKGTTSSTRSYRSFGLHLHHCLSPKPRNQQQLFSLREKW
jgi:hypothetical protein